MDGYKTRSWPALLMLCHCVPDASGGEARSGAWRELETAAQAHRVYLACVWDGPVGLAQWRRLNSVAERIVIEAPPRLRRWSDPAIRLFSPVAADSARLRGTLGPAVATWQRSVTFDLVLCTHPALRHGISLDAPVHECIHTAVRFLTTRPQTQAPLMARAA